MERRELELQLHLPLLCPHSILTEVLKNGVSPLKAGKGVKGEAREGNK